MTEHTEGRDRMAKHIADMLANHVFGPRSVTAINGNIITLAVNGVTYTITVCVARNQPKEEKRKDRSDPEGGIPGRG